MTTQLYRTYTNDQLEEHYSQFLIDSWSYSKVTNFARNEKSFEMAYIYGLFSKSSTTTIAGQAYHRALQYYFSQRKEGVLVDLVELERAAFEYIEEVPGNRWKLQKTTPTVDDCVKKALTTVSNLLRFFIGEIKVYEDDIDEIMDVEVYCDEFVTVNGVDIPLPCHAKLDLVVKTKGDKIAIVDHKSKATFTDDAEVALGLGVQAITYVKAYEQKTGLTVDEVWFIENKYSANKDKSSQLSANKVTLDENTRKLYEALLYEPLKRMIEAVNNPDYVYLINESDNYIDKAELYDFWTRTMICEVEDFNVEESKKDLVAKRLRKVRDASIRTISPAVIKRFKEKAASFIQYDLSSTNMTQEQKIEHVLRSFGTAVQVSHKFDGYSSDTYLLSISAGVKVSSIYSHRLDLANALDASDVRISSKLVMYEGKSYLGVEVAKRRERNVLFDPAELLGYKIPIGKDNFGRTLYWDLDNQSTPHALICGATGSGKSVCVESIIEYAILTDLDQILIFDPKFEFTRYNFIGDARVRVFNEILEIEQEMQKQVDHMNELVKTGRKQKILVVFDEVADAYARARSGPQLKIYEQVFDGFYANGGTKQKRQHTGDIPSLQENTTNLLQKGRSSGYRVLYALQRASTDVIDGKTKVNFPVQVCFRVQKEVDSRVVLDEPGAEKLMGKGDGLFRSPDYDDTVRFQAFYKPSGENVKKEKNRHIQTIEAE